MDYIYNHDLIRDMIITIKGPERSFDQLAKDAGISPAGLSQVYSGYYRATARFIKYITAVEANPYGLVTEQEMLSAAGLIKTKEKREIPIPAERIRNDGLLELYADINIVNIMANIIDTTLARKYKIDYISSVVADKRSITAPNCAYSVYKEEENEYRSWWFYYMHPIVRGGVYNRNGEQAYRYVGGRQKRLSNMTSFFKLPDDPERKITLVYESVKEYDRVLEDYCINSYRGNLSVALIDLDNREIICEHVIATYDKEKDLFKLD